MESRTTAKYQVIQDAGGWRFRFYCDASGALGCATEVYRGERPEDALAAAWECEGRRQFNLVRQMRQVGDQRDVQRGQPAMRGLCAVDSPDCFLPRLRGESAEGRRGLLRLRRGPAGRGGSGGCMRRYCRRTTAQGSASVRRA